MSEEELSDLRFIDCSSSEIELVNKAVNTIENLQQRIDKAIEFIKENTVEENNGCGYKWEMIYNDYLTNDLDRLLEILKGDNND